MQNTITIVGKAAKDAFVNTEKTFAAVNAEIPGPGGRGRAWMDVVAFGAEVDLLSSLKAGDKIEVVAAPDSKKNDTRGWQLRFVAVAKPDLAQQTLDTEAS